MDNVFGYQAEGPEATSLPPLPDGGTGQSKDLPEMHLVDPNGRVWKTDAEGLPMPDYEHPFFVLADIGIGGIVDLCVQWKVNPMPRNLLELGVINRERFRIPIKELISWGRVVRMSDVRAYRLDPLYAE